MASIFSFVLGVVLAMSTTQSPPGQPNPMQPGDYTPAAPALITSWQLKRLPPPSSLYITPDDQLVIAAASSLTNEVVTLNYRLLRAADGVIVRGQITVAPPNTRAVQVNQQQLAEGFILSASVRAALATTRGQTFVRVFLGAGPFGSGEPSYMLMSDYATTAMAPAHPNGRQVSPVEGPGLPTTYSIGTVFGQGISVIIPANARWRVLELTGRFTASAVAGTRYLQLLMPVFTDNNVALPIIATVAASTSVVCSWVAKGGNFNDTLGGYQQPLPADLYLSGNTLSTTQLAVLVTGIQSGDLWSHVAILVEEWLDNV